MENTTKGSRNKQFLATVDQETKDNILQSIARHYGVSVEVVEKDMEDDEALELHHYMMEPDCTATKNLMRQHGFA